MVHGWINIVPTPKLKLSADKYCSPNHLKPVVQVTGFIGHAFGPCQNEKWYMVGLSDGSFKNYLAITYKLCVSNKLQQGSIIQLTKYYYYSKNRLIVFVSGLHVIHAKCDIIGDPSLLPVYVPPISDHECADSDVNEDVVDSHRGVEPSALKQNPSDSTQNCSSRSLAQSKKRKRKVQSSNHNISAVAKDISKVAKMLMEKEDKLVAVAKDVSKMTRMMMKKNKEDDMGACIEKLEKMGWGAQEPMYHTALFLFGQSADYRKLWLHLKPESCGKWVKNAGSMFGVLD